MTPLLDATHDPALRSWVESANADDTDFPVQNLPFGRFHTADDPSPRMGIAIGTEVLDLKAVANTLQQGPLGGTPP